jgi:periplasmic protein TonB
VDGLDKQQRVFAYALAASLVLHAVVLAVRTPEFSGPAEFAAAPLVAHIVRVEPYPEPPAQPEVAPPKPKAEKPRAEKPKPRLPEKPAPITAPLPEPQAPSSIPAPAPAPSEPAAAAAEPAPEAPRAASAPPAQVAVPPSMTVGQYRQMLITEARRYNDYPPRAQDNGWEGDVVVRIAVAASGQVSEMKVQRGSGHSLLDEQALKTLSRVVQRVPVPPPLRGQEFAFEVRMVYSLKN